MRRWPVPRLIYQFGLVVSRRGSGGFPLLHLESTTERIQQCALKLGANRQEVHRHIHAVLDDDRFDEDTDWFAKARQQVEAELSLLCRPISGYTFQPAYTGPDSCIGAIIHMLKTPAQAKPTAEAISAIRNLDESINNVNSRIKDCDFIENTNPTLFNDRIDRCHPHPESTT